MATVRRWVFPLSVLSFCLLHKTGSVQRAIWNTKLAHVRNLFDGGTNEDEEDEALAVVLGAESYPEIAFMVNSLGWDALDDDLDEHDLTEIAGRISVLRNRPEHLPAAVIRGLALDPNELAKGQADKNAAAIAGRVRDLGRFGRQALADQLVSATFRRDLLDSQARLGLRDLQTHARDLRLVLDELGNQVPARSAELRALSWDVLYTDLICAQLERASYRLLLRILPDIVDPTLPTVRRQALFDTLKGRDGEIRALQDYIEILGNAKQRADADRFMDARQVFMDAFSPDPPTPTVIQQVAAFFNAVVDEILALREAVLNFSQDLLDSLNLSHLTGEDSDDKCREASGTLGGNGHLALLASRRKSELIFRMEEDNCDDDDEHEILRVLRTAKQHSIAEFAQLVAAQGWESLDFSFDGSEYAELETLLSEW